MKILIQSIIDDKKMSNNHAEGIEDFSKKIKKCELHEIQILDQIMSMLISR